MITHVNHNITAGDISRDLLDGNFTNQENNINRILSGQNGTVFNWGDYADFYNRIDALASEDGGTPETRAAAQAIRNALDAFAKQTNIIVTDTDNGDQYQGYFDPDCNDPSNLYDYLKNGCTMTYFQADRSDYGDNFEVQLSVPPDALSALMAALHNAVSY